MIPTKPTDDQFHKARWQFKSQMRQLLSPFDMYGQGVLFEEICEQSAKLAGKYHRRLNGEDVPISTDWWRIK